jgi:hypothetical protein
MPSASSKTGCIKAARGILFIGIHVFIPARRLENITALEVQSGAFLEIHFINGVKVKVVEYGASCLGISSKLALQFAMTNIVRRDDESSAFVNDVTQPSRLSVCSVCNCQLIPI